MEGRIENMSFRYGGEIPAGGKGSWEWLSEGSSKRILESTIDTLSEEKLLPRGEELNGWVFFSPTSNFRIFESSVLHTISKSIEGMKLEEKPKVITSDIAGYYVPTAGNPKISVEDVYYKKYPLKSFKPTFTGQMQDKNVDCLSVASDAYEIPLRDNSVDLIWDRLGAVWHTIYAESLFAEPEKDIIVLLDSYRRVLKDAGSIVIDAYEIQPKGAPSISSYALLKLLLDHHGSDLLKGWDLELIGEGESRMAVLHKQANTIEKVESKDLHV